MMKPYFSLAAAAVVLGGAWLLTDTKPAQEPRPEPAAATTPPGSSPSPAVSPAPILPSPRDMPFVAQAPAGNWQDIVFQNACEEASALMAMRWAEGNASAITAGEALREIGEMIDFEEKKYGYHLDTSAEQTARFMRDYFNYDGIEVKRDISAADIRQEIVRGKIVIVPVNGQKLPNPFYTPPGPLRHMLVIKGYDAQTKEFITNDPGTKRGESFRYAEQALEGAVRDYPTGYHEPIIQEIKAMIVIEAR